MLPSKSTFSLYSIVTTWLICSVQLSLVVATDVPASPESRSNATLTTSFRSAVAGAGAFPLGTCSGFSVNRNHGEPVMPMNTNTELSQVDPWFLSESANSFTGNADDYWDELECDALFSQGIQRPIHNASTWQFLRGVYLGVVGPHLSTIAMEDLFRHDGFAVPVKVVHIPNKGRGVIALQDIPEGTFVWDTIHTARFPSPTMYRRFLASLPQDLACDVMLWAYVEDYAEDSSQDDSAKTTTTTPRPTISVDLDAASFMNTVSAKDVTNMNPQTYQTNRLVRAGEELIVDYRDFEKEGSWNAAGFGTQEKYDDWS